MHSILHPGEENAGFTGDDGEYGGDQRYCIKDALGTTSKETTAGKIQADLAPSDLYVEMDELEGEAWVEIGRYKMYTNVASVDR